MIFNLTILWFLILCFIIFQSYAFGPVLENNMQILPPLPSKSGQFFLSQNMHNVLNRMQKQFSDFFCRIFLFKKVLCFLNWFRDGNQWYPITSWPGGFNPKPSGAWGRSVMGAERHGGGASWGRSVIGAERHGGGAPAGCLVGEAPTNWGVLGGRISEIIFIILVLEQKYFFTRD